MIVRLSGGRSTALVALLAASGCSLDRTLLPLRPAGIVAYSVGSSANNVLSAIVTAQVRNADSITVEYAPAGGAREKVTQLVSTGEARLEVPLLGLEPETRYLVTLSAFGAVGPPAAAQLEFETEPLPPDMPQYSAGGPGPSPGFVVFAAGMYGLVMDNAGRIVWYRGFPSGPGLNFMPQPNGRYVARPQPPDPAEAAVWIEIDVLGNVTRTLGCARRLQPRMHDLIMEKNGGYWTMCDETRTMDLSAVGGVSEARVTGTVVQHIGPDGALLFEWNAFDHFEITDLEAESRSGAFVNWTHGNAIDLDEEGNLYISFRNLNEVTKIDTRTSRVIWRMGGIRNQFTFEGTAQPAFASQHGLRVTGPGRLLLLDNLGDPSESKAERYEYDETSMVVRLVASYGSLPAVTALLGGTTQELPANRVLVAFGNGGRVAEYDASGRAVWWIAGDPGYVFRAQRIHSLYAPGVEWSRFVQQ